MKAVVMEKAYTLKSMLKQVSVFVFVFTGVMFWGHYFYAKYSGKVSTLLQDQAWDTALKNESQAVFHFDMKPELEKTDLIKSEKTRAVQIRSSAKGLFSEVITQENSTVFLNKIAAGSIISITNPDGKTAWFKIVRKKTSADMEHCADHDAPQADTALVKCMSLRTASMPLQEYVLKPIKRKVLNEQHDEKKDEGHNRL